MINIDVFLLNRKKSNTSSITNSSVLLQYDCIDRVHMYIGVCVLPGLNRLRIREPAWDGALPLIILSVSGVRF